MAGSGFIQQVLSKKEDEWERLCLRCGRCCGSNSDPCIHLKKDKDDRFFCEVYERRFGWHRTISGRFFRCVSIREVKREGYLPIGCGYR